jgi:hypothetical protein
MGRIHLGTHACHNKPTKKKKEIKEGSMAQYFEKDPLYEDTIGKDCLLPINFDREINAIT